jgi:hypothetical protein
MYDKITLWLPRTRETPDVDKYLTNATNKSHSDTGELLCTNGYCKNMNVCIREAGISIIGSLPKFKYGTNIQPLDRRTTPQAIEELSDSLHLDVRKSKVTGLEFGDTFLTQEPVGRYFSRLERHSKMARIPLADGALYFRPKGKYPQRELVFYDKKKEIIDSGGDLPAGYDGCNCLRYEIRLKSREISKISKLISIDITASTLSEICVYETLIKKWQDEYFSIIKKNMKVDNGTIKTPKEGIELLFAKLLAQTEPSVIDGFIEELKQSKALVDRQAVHRLRKRIYEIMSRAGVHEEDELIKELDDEIRNAGSYY